MLLFTNLSNVFQEHFQVTAAKTASPLKTATPLKQLHHHLILGI